MSDVSAPTGPAKVVALLGKGVIPADTPILRADDLGALRGDGIFESMHVRPDGAWLLDEHLDRMANSAARMDLTLPPRPELADLVRQAVRAWPAGVEAAVRLVVTRGAESADGGPPTVFATVSAVGAASKRARHEGLAVVSATLGFPAELRPNAPWLLGGAKTLSYAINMASQRWATSVGADDVLWTSADGYALEAPTSTLVWLEGSTLWTVPAAATGILPGTTAAWLLAHAGDLGFDTSERMIATDDLAGVDGAWFTSSVRGVAPLRSLDGRPLAWSPPVTARIREWLGYA